MVDNKILIPSVVGGTVFLIIFGLATKEYWNYRKKENRRIEGEARKEVERIDRVVKKNKEKRREKQEEKKQEDLDIIFGQNPEFDPEEYYEVDGIGKGIVKKSKKHKRNGKHKTKRSKH
jgi:hypothetical protein